LTENSKEKKYFGKYVLLQPLQPSKTNSTYIGLKHKTPSHNSSTTSHYIISGPKYYLNTYSTPHLKMFLVIHNKIANHGSIYVS